MFRWLTTRFEHSEGAEGSANVRAVGWEPRYRTHYLALSPGADPCGLTDKSTGLERLQAEADWSRKQGEALYAGFGARTLALCESLELTQVREWQLNRPQYLPLWVIQADPTVIDGHNDFLNVHFVDFVRQVYYTILSEQDTALRRRIENPPVPH